MKKRFTFAEINQKRRTMSRESIIKFLGELSQDDLKWLKDTLFADSGQPLRRDTLDEYRNDIEEGIRQVQSGKFYSTEDVFRMCMEDEVLQEAV